MSLGFTPVGGDALSGGGGSGASALSCVVSAVDQTTALGTPTAVYPTVATGFCSTALGTPKADVVMVPAGFCSTAVGTPSASPTVGAVGFLVPGQRRVKQYPLVLPDGFVNADPRWGFVKLFKGVNGVHRNMFNMVSATPYPSRGDWSLAPHGSGRAIYPSPLGMAAGFPYGLVSGTNEGVSNLYEVRESQQQSRMDFAVDAYTLVAVLRPQGQIAVDNLRTVAFEWWQDDGSSSTPQSRIVLNWWRGTGSRAYVTVNDDDATHGVYVPQIANQSAPFGNLVVIARVAAGEPIEILCSAIGEDDVWQTLPTIGVATQFTIARTHRVRVGAGTVGEGHYAFPGYVAAVGVMDRLISDAEAREIVHNPAAMFEPEDDYLLFSSGGNIPGALVGADGVHVHAASSGAVSVVAPPGSTFAIEARSIVAPGACVVAPAETGIQTYTWVLPRTASMQYAVAGFEIAGETAFDWRQEVVQQSVALVPSSSAVLAIGGVIQDGVFGSDTESLVDGRGGVVLRANFSIQTSSGMSFGPAPVTPATFVIETQSLSEVSGNAIVVAGFSIDTVSLWQVSPPFVPPPDSLYVVIELDRTDVMTRQHQLTVRSDHV